MMRPIILLVALALPSATASGADQRVVFTYQSTVSSSTSGLLDLKAELNYNDSRTKSPIAVVMHGLRGNLTDVRENAQRLRDKGFFVISVSMRGRDGSDGTPDYGGLEIFDIYDAVEAVKTRYAGRVDPISVYITGYSGGGGNAMSAVTKFPDYFRACASFFGISDYGYDPTSGWYHCGGTAYRAKNLNPVIGDRSSGDAAVRDRYMARASNLAARNNPYTEIRLFVNDDEPTCPPVQDTSYRDNAVAAASVPGEFNNIYVHIGSSAHPQYQDFNGNGQDDADEKQYWPHGYPTADQQNAAEAWFLPRLLNGSIPQPQLKPTGRLFVAGFVKTRPFECWLGDGQDAAGALDYSLSADRKTFHLDVLSSNRSVTGRLKVHTHDMAGRQVEVVLNGKVVDQFTGGETYQCSSLGDSDMLVLAVRPK